MKKTLLIVATIMLSLFLVSCSQTKYDDHYIVVFFTGQHGKVETIQVDKGSKIDRPEDPTSDIGLFEEWYSDIGLTEEYDFTKPIEKSTTIYAKFTYPEFEITYNLEADAVNDARNIETYKYSLGKVRIYPATRPGFIFRGWYLNADLSGPVVEYLEISTVTEDLTLYPRWR